MPLPNPSFKSCRALELCAPASRSSIPGGPYQSSLNREESQVVTAGDVAPQSAGKTDCHDDREQTQPDQIPGAVVREELVQQIKQHHPDDRTLDRADAADHDDKNRERGP